MLRLVLCAALLTGLIVIARGQIVQQSSPSGLDKSAIINPAPPSAAPTGCSSGAIDLGAGCTLTVAIGLGP